MLLPDLDDDYKMIKLKAAIGFQSQWSNKQRIIVATADGEISIPKTSLL